MLNKTQKIYAVHILVLMTGTNSVALAQSIIKGFEPTVLWFVLPSVVGSVLGSLLARVKILADRLEAMASTDVLTGVMNRRAVTTLLHAEMERSRRYASHISIILFDIDHFKRVNDSHGHAVGDEILCEIASLADSVSRSTDAVGRWGGEEFLLVLPETQLEDASLFAERLRGTIAEWSSPTCELNVTCSFGVAEFVAKVDDFESLVTRADEAMYEAKETGRDRVITSRVSAAPRA